MASASRDKFSRDDEPELGDIDADVLDAEPVSPASASSRPSRKASKRGRAGSSGDDSYESPNAGNNTPTDPSPVASHAGEARGARASVDAGGPSTAGAATAPAAPQSRPVHTFGWTRMIFWPLVLAFVALQYRLWIGEGSFAEVWRLKLEIEKQEQENHVLGERNRRLSAEVRDLREGGAAVEERARKQLGMVKDDETLYIIHPKSP